MLQVQSIDKKENAGVVKHVILIVFYILNFSEVCLCPKVCMNVNIITC